MLFSEREGYKIRQQQHTGINDETRNQLWNCFYDTFHSQKPQDSFRPSITEKYKLYSLLVERIWCSFIKNCSDEFHNVERSIDSVKNVFLRDEWYRVFDLIEFILKIGFITSSFEYNKQFFKDICNVVLMKELSVYKIVDKFVVPISSEQEIEEIEKAVENTKPFQPINIHLTSSLRLLSDRNKPDYRNSIKESISAVEALCKMITKEPKATLGGALKKINKSDKINIHPALEEAFEKMYGYTCDADGIRHSLMDESNLDIEDARYFLVVCSSFVNYLITKCDKANMDLLNDKS